MHKTNRETGTNPSGSSAPFDPLQWGVQLLILAVISATLLGLI